jgi:hypothetical protein
MVIVVIGYLRAASIAQAWGPESGWGLTAPSAFIKSMGFTACITGVILLLSCLRRERLWPISLLLLIPVSLYAILYLVISLTYPR